MAALGYKNKKVFVYGMGKSGLATVAALYADGAEVYVYDSRPLDTLMEEGSVRKLMDKPRVFFADAQLLAGDRLIATASGTFRRHRVSPEEAVITAS